MSWSSTVWSYCLINSKLISPHLNTSYFLSLTDNSPEVEKTSPGESNNAKLINVRCRKTRTHTHTHTSGDVSGSLFLYVSYMCAFEPPTPQESGAKLCTLYSPRWQTAPLWWVTRPKRPWCSCWCRTAPPPSPPASPCSTAGTWSSVRRFVKISLSFTVTALVNGVLEFEGLP